MAITSSDVLSREIYAAAIQAATRNSSAFLANGNTAKAGMVNISGSFTGDANSIGTTVSIPYFNQIGTFQTRTDGSSASYQTPAGGLLVKEPGTVTARTLAFELTDWAQNSTIVQDVGSIYNAAVASVQNAAVAAMDEMIVAAAVATNTTIATGSKNLTTDVYNASTPRYLDSDLLVDARMLFEDLQDNFAALVVHPLALRSLFKLRDQVGNPLLTNYANGGMPTVWGVPVFVSGACNVPTCTITTGSISVDSGTSPAITIAGTANRYVSIKIKCTTGGTLGNSKVVISVDGGKTWSRAEITTVGSGSALTIVSPHDGSSTGVTVYWAAGTSVVGETWTVPTTSVKVASHFVKKGAFAFWYNAAKLADLQSVMVPAADMTQNAIHLYAVAHRYNQLPGSRLPGVATIYHNGAL